MPGAARRKSEPLKSRARSQLRTYRRALACAPSALVCLLFLTAGGVVSAPARAQSDAASPGRLPTIRIGDGSSQIVEYDFDLHPLRRWVGLHDPRDVTGMPDGSLLIVDEGAKLVRRIDADGNELWSEAIGGYPLRARPRPGGGYLVTAIDRILALDADRQVEFEIPLRGVVAAVPLANGNIVAAYNAEDQGWLAELRPDGSRVWRSAPRGYEDAAGHWVDENPNRFFVSVYSLDAGTDGSILAANFDGKDVRLLGPNHEVRKAIPYTVHPVDVRLGKNGEIAVVTPEQLRVGLELPGEPMKWLRPPLEPRCASVTPWGTLLVGLLWKPEAAVLNATAERERVVPAIPWWQRGLPVPVLGAFLALLSAVLLRRRDARSWLARSECASEAASDHLRPLRRRVIALLVVLVVLAAASTLAWYGSGIVDRFGFVAAGWPFLVGCVAGGVALRVLGGQLGAPEPIGRFRPATWRAPGGRGDRGRTAILLVLSLTSLSGCVVVLRLAPAEQAAAIALWIAAQIWIVAAAFPPRAGAGLRPAGWTVRVIVMLLVAAAVVTHFWQIGFYPDVVHHDHALFGADLLRTWRGDWNEFFSRIYSVGRPWALPFIAAFEVFGVHYWVLRLTAAISGVVVVAGTYLLGTSLFSRRVGLLAAALVLSNHILFLYSRLPYVVDPVAPFVLGLWATAEGLRRGCRFRCCAAGVLFGWSLLGYHASTIYVLVGAVLFAYLLVFHGRVLWRSRSAVLWIAAGAVVVYLPMIAASAELLTTARANSLVVFLNPDGSIRWDASLLATQLQRSFGYLFHWYSDGAWGVTAWRSLLLRTGSCAFGIGLVYILISRWTPATLLLIAWPALCLFFGSAILPGAPTPYHFLAAIVPLLLIAALAVDRVFAVGDALRAPWRWGPYAVGLALAAVLVGDAAGVSWRAVERKETADGQPRYRSDPIALAARFIREHPRYRYYLVRSRTDLSSAAPVFFFFAADSDLSDISTDLRAVLPVPDVDPAIGAAFLVLPSRFSNAGEITAVYPSAKKIEQHSAFANGDLWIYLVDAAAARAARESAAADRAS